MFKLKEKKQSLIYIVIFVSLIIFLSSLTPAFRPAVLNTLKYPLYFLSLIQREIGGIIFYHRNLVQNERNQKEMDFLKQKINSLEEASLENNRLKEILAFKQNSSYKVIAARVIGHSEDNWSSGIIIDKGSHHGIKRGYVVITYLGLAGRVVDTTSATSKIMLINDSNFNVSSIIQRSRQEGLISGALGNSLIMKYLSKDSDIKLGDTVITSGLTESYPKGLLVGTIIDIGEELSGISRYAMVRPAVNLSSIEEVLIIIPW